MEKSYTTDIIPQQNIETLAQERFESFEQFKEFILTSFVEGSGIDPELFDACVEFHCDQEFDYGGEVSTPIHDELDWEFTRFGHQAKEPMYAAFLKNEDGSTWQAIVSIWDDEKQRPYQYKAPKRIGDRVFLPPVPPGIRRRIGNRYGIEVPLTGSFWEWYENIDIPRLPTEGGKKALCLLSLGYVALALFGCKCGVKTKDESGEDESGSKAKLYLIPDLQRFAAPDSRWLSCFDKDSKHKAKLDVAYWNKKRKIALNLSECFIADILWKSEQGKGVDDFVVNNGSGSFDAAYLKAIAALERALAKDSVPESPAAQSKRKQQMNLIHSRWGEKLRFNEMTLKVELDGEPLDLDTLACRLADELNIDIGNNTAVQIVLYLAKTRVYNPVREYLEQVAAEYPNQDLSILDDIATRYFDSTEPLHNTFMRKHLIGQVRRIMEPGCQHDTVLVLQGDQGIQKSTFWRTLAVDPQWFDDTIASSSNDKDERLKLRRFWILELAEIESVFKRKEIASLRGFLTTKCDNLRVPYGRSIESFARTSCFVASVNPSQFLVDPEGHRRFWVVPVSTGRIPVEKLVEERDLLWAAAVHAYRKGEQHWLTPKEEKRNALLNKRHEVEDSWQEIIDFYLENQSEVTVSSILSNCLKMEVGRHDRSSQMRVVESLKRLGWVKREKKKVNGKVIQIWRSQPGHNQVATEVATDSNQDIVSISEKRLLSNDETQDYYSPSFRPNIVSSINNDVPSDTTIRFGLDSNQESLEIGHNRENAPTETAETLPVSTSEAVVTSVATWLRPSEENEKSTLTEVVTEAQDVATEAITPSLPCEVGDTVEFWHQGEKQWMKGKVEAVEQEKGILIKASIRYWAWGKSRTESIGRTDWLR
ncbi:VapE domain-containing protein [Scytonema sp. PCC 10023]|uniref:VapE domain-containing protein n=1 Tax=Scytonema sp. PCC 10023 TaxID=1680591 RepID=UPI0039C6B05A